MKILEFAETQPTNIENEQTKGIAARVVIGKNDGATNFCMRVFEVASGGHTPLHSHAWEHEIFIHSGAGELYGNGQWNLVKSGNVVFIPGEEQHQLRNTGTEPLTFVCLVPSYAPEL